MLYVVAATFSVEVHAAAPTVANAIPDQSATAGMAFSYQFPANTFNDADGDALTYTATQSDDSDLPAWLTFDATSRTFSGRPEESDVATLMVKVTADDSNGGTVSDTFDLVVNSSGDTDPPTVVAESTTVNGATVTITYNEALDENSVPTVNGFIVLRWFNEDDPTVLNPGVWTHPSFYCIAGNSVGGCNRDLVSTQVSGSTVILTLPALVAADASDRVAFQYSKSFAVNPIQDLVGNDAASIAPQRQSLVNQTPNVLPTASDNTVSATEDTDYVFEVSDFNFMDSDRSHTMGGSSVDDGVVKIESLPGEGTLLNDGTVIVSGDLPQTVHGRAIDRGELVYTPPLDSSGDDFTSFMFKVNDGTDDSADSYTMTINVDVANDAPVVANAIPDRTATVGTAFSFQFAANTFSDVDDSTLNYEAVQSDDSDLPSWLTFTDSTRTFSGTPQSGDVGTVSVKVTAYDYDPQGETPPDGQSASDTFDIVVSVVVNVPPTASDGEVSTSEDTAYTFDASDFDFADSDSGDTLSSVKLTSLPASGRGILSLAGATITSGALPQTVTKAQLDNGELVYRPPAGQSGNDFATFGFRVNDGEDDSASAYTMTVDVREVSAVRTNVPVFPQSDVTRSVMENTAPDTHIGDALPGATNADNDALAYTLEGEDADSFSFDSATRQLKTKAGVIYDYEAKASYSVVLRAGDNDGTATLAVTVDVTDVNEPPAAPAAPSVHPAEDEMGLQVIWSAPDNAGRPAITAYDLRYRIKGASSWSDGPQAVVGMRATITGLAEATTYQVQVRANNDEGIGAWSASGEGMIGNPGAMPKAWLARFGRTVSEQVIEAVGARLSGKRTPGTQVQVAGQALDADTLQASEVRMKEAEQAREDVETREQSISVMRSLENGQTEPQYIDPGTRTLTIRHLLSGTSFSLTGESATGALVSVWGRGAITGFDGRDDALNIDGEVETVMLGADWSRDAWTTGLLFSHSRGDGDYHGEGEGRVESELTGLWPYGRYQYNPRLSLWGIAGYGQGEMDLKLKGRTSMETDMDLLMGAVGVRGIAREAREGSGLELAITSDALAVQTSSERTTGLASAEADVTRVRLGLEGTWKGLETDIHTWAPSLEVGIRHDGGDAETGFGAEVGTGLTYRHREYGITTEFRARGLITHEEGGFENVGISGSLAWDPRPASHRGPAFTLSQTLGAPDSGGMDALLRRATMGGLNPEGSDREADSRQLQFKVGYGFGIDGGQFILIPELGLGRSANQHVYQLGARLDRATHGPGAMTLDFRVRRREPVHQPTGPEHDVGLRMQVQF